MVVTTQKAQVSHSIPKFTPAPKTFTLVPVGSVANVIEGNGQVLWAAQASPLTIGWPVGD
jgi:hypothetical protein